MTFDQSEMLPSPDRHVYLARLLWIVGVDYVIVPGDLGARVLEQLVNPVNPLFE